MSVENSTFTSRAAAAYASEPREDDTNDTKAVEAEQAENKAVARKSTRTKKK